MFEKQKATTDKELSECRNKLSNLAKENDDLRKKLLENEQSQCDAVLGRYVSNGSANGRIVYQGSKGGKYYLTKKGTKTYLPRGALIEELSDEEAETF